MSNTPLDLTDRTLGRNPAKEVGSAPDSHTAAGVVGPGDDASHAAEPAPAAGGPSGALSEGASGNPSSTASLDLAMAPLPDDDSASHAPGQIPEAFTGNAFGTLLEPVLRRACDDRLGKLNWFRTPWQRGGAVTGFSTFRADDGEEHSVVVKMPVPPCERHWLVALQQAGDVAPRVHAHGETLNGYDLAWVVMERLPHGPLGPTWKGNEFDLLVNAIGRFYAASQAHPLHGQSTTQDWDAILERSRRAVRDGNVSDGQRWQQALKKAHKKLKSWVATWHDRPTDGWCHGDLHLANAMSRDPAPEGPALLLDFALTHVGHWLEDAIYFEHLFWGHRDRLGGRKLAKQIAVARRERDLPVESDWAQLAQVKRALLAMAAPGKVRHESSPRYLAGALEVLEREV